MKLSLNLDNYLNQFLSLTFCQDILNEYYKKEQDGVTILDDSSEYYYYTDNSELYYKGLVESRFPILYRLVQNILIPSITINNKEYNLSWKDWYYITLNAYNLRGSVRSVYYIFTYLGIEILEKRDPETNYQIEFYDKNYLSLKLSVALKTNSPILTKKDITALCKELLLIQSEEIDIEILYINYLVENKSYLYVNTFTNRFPRINKQFSIGNHRNSGVLRNHLESLEKNANTNGAMINTEYVDFLLDHTYITIDALNKIFTDYYYPAFYIDPTNTKLDIVSLDVPDIRFATNTVFEMNLDKVYQPDFYRANHIDIIIDTPDISYPTNDIIVIEDLNPLDNEVSYTGTNLSNYQPTFRF